MECRAYTSVHPRFNQGFSYFSRCARSGIQRHLPPVTASAGHIKPGPELHLHTFDPSLVSSWPTFRLPVIVRARRVLLICSATIVHKHSVSPLLVISRDLCVFYGFADVGCTTWIFSELLPPISFCPPPVIYHHHLTMHPRSTHRVSVTTSLCRKKQTITHTRYEPTCVKFCIHTDRPTYRRGDMTCHGMRFRGPRAR